MAKRPSAPKSQKKVETLRHPDDKRVNIPTAEHQSVLEAEHLAAGAQTFGRGLRLKTTDVQKPQRVPGPVTFLPGSAPLRLGGRPYRGQFLVSVAGGGLRAVNSVSLEAYLYGVVPSEMPKDWLPEALKAQAVAARTYALAVRKTGGWFDLYPDTRSQVYLGIAHEAPSTTAAVQETAGEVVLYEMIDAAHAAVHHGQYRLPVFVGVIEADDMTELVQGNAMEILNAAAQRAGI